ncbi:MAG: hypothetical protein U9N84_11860 [Actinomycetota bacterium]|nr:hypothetical protein [Actinomycetota bacterium]
MSTQLAQPTRDEIDDVLTQRLKATVATINPDGSLHLAFVIFLYEKGLYCGPEADQFCAIPYPFGTVKLVVPLDTPRDISHQKNIGASTPLSSLFSD